MNFSERMRMLVRLWKYRLREESESISFMRRQPLVGRTVIDVGANKGIYSFWMSRQVGPCGRVVAFEPQLDLRPHLDDFKHSFGLGNLQIVSQGLSNRPGTAAMRRDKPGALGASLEPPAPEENAARTSEMIEVAVTTLDQFCAAEKLADVAFIKCDVEGHELAVFQGGRELLQRQRPVLLFECHHHEAQRGALFAFFAELDYDGFFVQNGERVPYQQFAKRPYRKPSIKHRNYMFAHRDVPAA
ncbi:MAG: FkbM family methyltransferase [Pirellulales bacterium]|nr:FkbM family methyltransferase [Pirellulales bacterium]